MAKATPEQNAKDIKELNKKITVLEKSLEKAEAKAEAAHKAAAEALSSGGGSPAPGKKKDNKAAKAAEKALHDAPNHAKEAMAGTFRREGFTPPPGRE